MSDESIDPAAADSAVELHADKFNDPRAKITSRGIWLGVFVAVFAVVGAAASIYGRRIQMEQTTRFWGEETITGLQLAERMELLSADKTVELTATPGLGHLRRALLEDGNFDWATESSEPVSKQCNQTDSICVKLRLTDPTAGRIGTVQIDLELKDGWVGPSDGSRRVRATSRAQPALQHFLETIMNVEQLRYDLRQKEQGIGQNPG